MMDIKHLKSLPPAHKLAKLTELENEKKKELAEIQKLKSQVIQDIRKSSDVFARFPEKKLDDIIQKDEVKTPQNDFASYKQYVQDLSKAPAHKLYERTKEIYSEAKETGVVTYQQRQELEIIGYATTLKSEAINAGEYPATQEVKKQLSVTHDMKDFLQSMYKR